MAAPVTSADMPDTAVGDQGPAGARPHRGHPDPKAATLDAIATLGRDDAGLADAPRAVVWFTPEPSVVDGGRRRPRPWLWTAACADDGTVIPPIGRPVAIVVCAPSNRVRVRTDTGERIVSQAIGLPAAELRSCLSGPVQPDRVAAVSRRLVLGDKAWRSEFRLLTFASQRAVVAGLFGVRPVPAGLLDRIWPEPAQLH